MRRSGLFAEDRSFTMAGLDNWAAQRAEEQGTNPELKGLGLWAATSADVFIFNDNQQLDADAAIGFGGGTGMFALMAAQALGDYLFSYVSGDDQVDDQFEYNVHIDFFGSEDDWTPALVEDFEAAADYLSSIITDDVTDAVFRSGFTIDDIRIQARLSDIDGSGGVLGQAGPTLLRPVSSLPIAGEMEFDIADASDFDAEGLWDEIVLHEMMHVLGIGTIWNDLGLLDFSIDYNGTWRRSDDTIDLRFNGSAGNEAFAAVFPDIFADSDGLGIFVETDGGPGTAGGHWDEDTFGAELMSGFIDDAGNYVSDMTIASLEDLGYETVWESAIA